MLTLSFPVGKKKKKKKPYSDFFFLLFLKMTFIVRKDFFKIKLFLPTCPVLLFLWPQPGLPWRKPIAPVTGGRQTCAAV